MWKEMMVYPYSCCKIFLEHMHAVLLFHWRSMDFYFQRNNGIELQTVFCKFKK